MIESFHDTFGFSSFGRPAVARNQATLVYDLKGAHVVLLDKPTDGGLAVVYYAGASQPAPQDSQLVPTLVVGYEYQLTGRTNLNLQGYMSTSVYSHDQTDLDELTGTKYQYSIGIRHRWDNMIVTFGFTENVQNVNNTPDVGLQLGLAYVPHLGASRVQARR
jgi:hypothetical protein